MKFLVALVLSVSAACAGEFLVKPYLQLGDAPKASSKETMTILWHAPDAESPWSVRYRTSSEKWRAAGASWRRVRLGPGTHRIYRVVLEDLQPGKTFDYEVLDGGKALFASNGLARKDSDHASRFVVFGDCGVGSLGQRGIAYQTHLAKPDYVFIPGDIVYGQGRISEYREKFFPIYNADEASPKTGAPLIRSTLFTAAPGNHDYAAADLNTGAGDGLAYFYYWSQPLNGPIGDPNAPNTPKLEGSPAARRALMEASGKQYPRMANFSFDYGSVHWTVLDSNRSVDWSDPSLLEWLEKDLKSAKDAAWRFVGFHHPGFNSSKAHFGDQWMRRLAPIFEKHKVTIVFGGHVHNYQRSFPMMFVAKPSKGDKVDGDWKLDREFDGASRTDPAAPIYIVSGAGGARLYNTDQFDPNSWQPFTARFEPRTHSFTLVDVDKKRLAIRQVSDEGKTIDEFAITR